MTDIEKYAHVDYTEAQLTKLNKIEEERAELEKKYSEHPSDIVAMLKKSKNEIQDLMDTNQYARMCIRLNSIAHNGQLRASAEDSFKYVYGLCRGVVSHQIFWEDTMVYSSRDNGFVIYDEELDEHRAKSQREIEISIMETIYDIGQYAFSLLSVMSKELTGTDKKEDMAEYIMKKHKSYSIEEYSKMVKNGSFFESKQDLAKRTGCDIYLPAEEFEAKYNMTQTEAFAKMMNDEIMKPTKTGCNGNCSCNKD